MPLKSSSASMPRMCSLSLEFVLSKKPRGQRCCQGALSANFIPRMCFLNIECVLSVKPRGQKCQRALSPVCADVYSVSVFVSVSVPVCKLCTGVWYTQMQPCNTFYREHIL